MAKMKLNLKLQDSGVVKKKDFDKALEELSRQIMYQEEETRKTIKLATNQLKSEIVTEVNQGFLPIEAEINKTTKHIFEL